MRTYRAESGRFRERPYFTDEEFETITAVELEKVGLMPAEPSPVDVERFIEKRFEITHEYEDLGEKVLGCTVFGDRGVARIIVNPTLEDGTNAGRRRVRTTLAHEVGHGLLHTHLFVLGLEQAPLFGDFSKRDAPRIMCREEQIFGRASGKRQSEWYEVQANRAMSALLLPRRLVREAVKPYLRPEGALGIPRLARSHRESAAHGIGEIFDVNAAVVRLRLDVLLPDSGQGVL